jgi:hypothetical protein
MSLNDVNKWCRGWVKGRLLQVSLQELPDSKRPFPLHTRLRRFAAARQGEYLESVVGALLRARYPTGLPRPPER